MLDDVVDKPRPGPAPAQEPMSDLEGLDDEDAVPNVNNWFIVLQTKLSKLVVVATKKCLMHTHARVQN